MSGSDMRPQRPCFTGRGCYALPRPFQRYEPMNAKKRRDEAGFTLLELLVVIVILGLLVSFVGPAVMQKLGGARTSVAKQSIERIGAVLDMYKLDTGTYPTADQGLRALIERPAGLDAWNGPYLKGDTPLDPWNHPYTYRFPSSRAGRDYDLCSGGPPGSTVSTDALCNP